MRGNKMKRASLRRHKIPSDAFFAEQPSFCRNCDCKPHKKQKEGCLQVRLISEFLNIQPDFPPRFRRFIASFRIYSICPFIERNSSSAHNAISFHMSPSSLSSIDFLFFACCLEDIFYTLSMIKCSGVHDGGSGFFGAEYDHQI